MPHMMVGERAPYWDEHLRGGLLGLTVYHTRAHVFRAILEGVAYAMRYSLEAAQETGMKINRATLVDGGARSPLWRQIIADVTGLKMSYIPGAQGAPIGDAMLAGLGTKVISGYSVIEKWIPEKIEVTPDPRREEVYSRCYGLYRAALDANKPVFRAFTTM
jgi:xylulokinase